jgi:hypothetical protein
MRYHIYLCDIPGIWKGGVHRFCLSLHRTAALSPSTRHDCPHETLGTLRRLPVASSIKMWLCIDSGSRVVHHWMCLIYTLSFDHNTPYIMRTPASPECSIFTLVDLWLFVQSFSFVSCVLLEGECGLHPTLRPWTSGCGPGIWDSTIMSGIPNQAWGVYHCTSRIRRVGLIRLGLKKVVAILLMPHRLSCRTVLAFNSHRLHLVFRQRMI